MSLFAVPTKKLCKKVKSFSQFMSFCSTSSSVVKSFEIAEYNNLHCQDYGDLRGKMQSFAMYGDVQNSLEVFRSMRMLSGKPKIYDYNAMLDCYLKSKNVCLHDISALYWELKTVRLDPNAITFNTLLKGLSILNESKASLLVVLEMRNHAFIPSFSALSIVLRKCLGFMELVDAISVVNLMLELNYIPTEPKFALLIKSLSRCGMTRDACLVFFKLLEKGCFQSAYIYNPILWSLCKSDQIKGALALFCFLTKKGLVHNVCSYTALVYGLGKKGLFKEISRCLMIMEAEPGCYPNVKTYTTFVKSLCDYGRIKDALVYLGKMEKLGCNPDVVTYNIIIRALSRQNMVLEKGVSPVQYTATALSTLLKRGNIGVAHSPLLDNPTLYFNTLYEKGISPDRYTATALSGFLKRGSLGVARSIEFARRLLQHIVSSSVDLDVAVYNVYLYCLCHARKPKELSSLFECMIKNGIKPNNITFNIILKWFCEVKSMDEALEFFERVEWPEKGLDLVSFNTILFAACKMDDSSMFWRIIDLMEKKGIKLNVVGLTCLMQYYCNTGKIDDCLEVFEYMISHGPLPSVVTVNTLMASLCKNHLLGAAYWIFCNLKNYGLSPDARTYDILIRAAVNERNYLLVTELESKRRMPE
uniref:pentatricopeptide repeat-containing protein At1g62680, mitochondrial-like n=1 Tax=Erigeron canadensis TaxID=72917 RepID=UPI001CB933CA|nr:pentatricopeptide repeat-containing protein At1g62680, mitochondrial-like [Erigeron canadensis]XP_043607718.1 pentatricopeptide repeat-containing protein At1g62680, mitochondrial-like [Erigeron canadensis]XP_043607719.1 pentatricopeptide repeat-containing protein At1g62680, mitochondrial-like [Erigeron canadensis]